MKTGIKCLLKVWVGIGAILTGIDVIGLVLCKVLEKIGKPSEKLSKAYSMINYSRKDVLLRYIVRLIAWPILIAASFTVAILNSYKGEGA